MRENVEMKDMIFNVGNYVENSNLKNSIVGNNNSTGVFDYKELENIITEIENVYKFEKQFNQTQLTEMARSIEEIKIAIKEKNQSKVQKYLQAIGNIVTNVGAGIIASGIWSKIQPLL
mgnify:FL=1